MWGMPRLTTTSNSSCSNRSGAPPPAARGDVAALSIRDGPGAGVANNAPRYFDLSVPKPEALHNIGDRQDSTVRVAHRQRRPQIRAVFDNLRDSDRSSSL